MFRVMSSLEVLKSESLFAFIASPFFVLRLLNYAFSTE